LLLAKFRAEAVIGFRDTADLPPGPELARAARDRGIPFALIGRDASEAQVAAAIRMLARAQIAPRSSTATLVARLALFVPALVCAWLLPVSSAKRSTAKQTATRMSTHQ
jgi:hypothetical protein